MHEGKDKLNYRFLTITENSGPWLDSKGAFAWLPSLWISNLRLDDYRGGSTPYEKKFFAVFRLVNLMLKLMSDNVKTVLFYFILYL